MLAHIGGLPATAPSAMESMTWPAYLPGARFVFAGSSGWLCPVAAPMAKTPARGKSLGHNPADEGQFPLDSNFDAFGRQQLADGVVLLPRLRPLNARPVVRTAILSSGPPAKASCPRPSLGWAGLRTVPWGPGRLRNSRGLKPHPGRTDSPGFLPIWGRTFPYHGNVADGQLRQTGSGDETVQPLLPRQTEQFRNFTNRLGFQFRGISEQPGLVRFRGHWTAGTCAVETDASNCILRRGNSWVRGLSGETGDLGSPPREFRCLRLCCVCPRRLRRGAAHWMRPGPDAQWNSGLGPGNWVGR